MEQMLDVMLSVHLNSETCVAYVVPSLVAAIVHAVFVGENRVS